MTIDAARARPPPGGRPCAGAAHPAHEPPRSKPPASYRPTSSWSWPTPRLFKVALLEAEGGLGADVLTALQVIEEVSRADGSTGWCLAMAINTFRQSAQLAPDVRRELFFSDPIGLSAGSARERGRAVAVPGRLPRCPGTGSSPAAACTRTCCTAPARSSTATRRGCGPMATRTSGSPSSIRNRRCASSTPGTSSGLRGTGSHDIVVEDLLRAGGAHVLGAWTGGRA